MAIINNIECLHKSRDDSSHFTDSQGLLHLSCDGWISLTGRIVIRVQRLEEGCY
jgi:hypothetical protein